MSRLMLAAVDHFQLVKNPHALVILFPEDPLILDEVRCCPRWHFGDDIDEKHHPLDDVLDVYGLNLRTC